MYKKDVWQYNSKLQQNMGMGKRTILLYREFETQYYEVSEYIVYLEKIIEKDGQNGISTIQVKFCNNESYKCYSYLDGTIKEGDIISVLGFIIDGAYGKIFCAKGGCCKVATKPKDIDYIVFDRVYRLGIITKLSLPTLSTSYPHYVLKTKPIQLIDKFYYYVEDYKEQETLNTETSKNNSSTGITTGATGGINIAKLANIQEDTEDIPDIENTPSVEDEETTQVETNEAHTVTRKFFDELGNPIQVSL